MAPLSGPSQGRLGGSNSAVGEPTRGDSEWISSEQMNWRAVAAAMPERRTTPRHIRSLERESHSWVGTNLIDRDLAVNP
jgi:hypothetical protein